MRSPSENAVRQRADYQNLKERLKQRAKTAPSEDAPKKCRQCQQEKPRRDFYNHPASADGKESTCKACKKARSAEQYATPEGRAKRVKYESIRFTFPSRKEDLRKSRNKRRESPEGKLKEAARIAVKRAIRRGGLVRLPCEKCGNPESEAHHDDYSKPLVVRWLCFCHHREAHGQIVTDKTYVTPNLKTQTRP